VPSGSVFPYRNFPRPYLVRMYPILLMLLLLWSVGRPVLQPPATTDVPTPEALFAEIERRAQAVRHETARVRMTILDARGRSRIREIDSWTSQRGADSRILVRFHAPADVRGTALLTIREKGQDVQKLYLPSVGRIQTVGAAQLSDRFMGSDFLFDDLRPVDYAGFTFQVTDRKPDRWIVKGTPSTVRTFAHAVFTVDPVRHVVLGATYHDGAGKPTRALTVSDLEEVRPGLWRGKTLTMKDLVADRRTELSWLARDVATAIPESMFTERELTRY
jgi:hypothetical protein